MAAGKVLIHLRAGWAPGGGLQSCSVCALGLRIVEVSSGCGAGAGAVTGREGAEWERTEMECLVGVRAVP